jgi:hypothetical protein
VQYSVTLLQQCLRAVHAAKRLYVDTCLVSGSVAFRQVSKLSFVASRASVLCDCVYIAPDITMLLHSWQRCTMRGHIPHDAYIHIPQLCNPGVLSCAALFALQQRRSGSGTCELSPLKTRLSTFQTVLVSTSEQHSFHPRRWLACNDTNPAG